MAFPDDPYVEYVWPDRLQDISYGWEISDAQRELLKNLASAVTRLSDSLPGLRVEIIPAE